VGTGRFRPMDLNFVPAGFELGLRDPNFSCSTIMCNAALDRFWQDVSCGGYVTPNGPPLAQVGVLSPAFTPAGLLFGLA
jgi:hypothetical protein